MTAKELKEYICKNDKVIEILENINCHSIKVCNDRYIQCGINNGDNPNSTVIFYNDNFLGVNAYTRNIKSKDQTSQSDIINLVAYSLGLEYISAKNYLIGFLKLENVGNSIRNKDVISFFRKSIQKAKREKAKNEQVYYDLDILDSYSNLFHIDLIKKDGLIDSNILNKYHVMFDERSERILFPHFKWDDHNKVCGIVGRTVNPCYKELKILKYVSMLPTRYDKTLNLYGLCWNIDYIKEMDEIIVVESEKSVMKSDMFNFPNCVSVGCHSISNEQKKIILGLNVKRIIIAMDKDVPQEEINILCDMFIDYMEVYYIVDKWNLLQEKDSPLDRGIKKWRYLYKFKTKYVKKIETKEESTKEKFRRSNESER